jgi:hypothetical protein
MAVDTGTYLKYDAKGLKEDLSNVIYDISPTDTPFMAGAAKGKASGTLFEWQVDSLAAVVTTNAVLEGNVSTFATPAATSRVGNYTQISEKTLKISGTLEAVDKAGRKSELAMQIQKKGKELKRDMEAMLLENIAGDAGGAGTARKTAGMGAWLKSNTDIATNGGDPTYTSGVPAAVRTDGAGTRAFTETILRSVLQQMWSSGGSVEGSVLMCGPVNRAKVSGFAGIATRNLDQSSPKPTAIIGSASVYVSDWGNVRVMANRFQRERDAWVIDYDMVEVAYLRPFAIHDLAKIGDAEQKLLNVEYGLKVKNEAGLGLAADLTTTA